jgi:hypothetical protein
VPVEFIPFNAIGRISYDEVNGVIWNKNRSGDAITVVKNTSRSCNRSHEKGIN